ncbi:MAG: transposase mutator type [Firmicutes bacterium]|nr:transposase mutator type [Bacillota bacterium]
MFRTRILKKAVYTAVDEQTALYQLDAFDEKWSGKYPKIALSWRANWANLSTYFKYPQEVRTLIYTTNAIENFNRQLRKVTKAKSVFLTDDSLLKMLYLAMIDITKKWTGRRRDWGQIHSHSQAFFNIIQTKGQPAQMTALPLKNICSYYANWSLYKIRDTSQKT